MSYHGFPSASERLLINAKLRVVKLVVIRSGTYAQMFARPYETRFNADVADALGRRIEQSGGLDRTANTPLLAGLASQIIMPARQPEGIIPIVNGWDSPRGRFNMTVEVTTHTGAQFFYHLQGYTDHYDLSLSGNADPNMVFYVNSYVKVSRAQAYGPNGVYWQDIVADSAQVINGRLVSALNQSDVYGLRPNEIFTVLHGESIGARLYQSFGDGGSSAGMIDSRHLLNTQNVPTSRSNNLPANMLARVVDSYNINHQLLNLGQDTEDVYTRSKGYVFEGSLAENGFFKQLANVVGVPETAQFTLKNLVAIDPNALHDDIAKFVVMDSTALRMVNTAGQSEQWHRPDDIQAWISTVLFNAVPTIMMELLITKMQFRATNHDARGINTVTFDYAYDMTGRDMAGSLAAFQQRFIHEIMTDLTHGNQELYMLHMSVDLLGDTVIDISFGANPMARYIAPSFCDSLMIPVITKHSANVLNVAHDFRQILDSVSSSASLANPVHPYIDGTV